MDFIIEAVRQNAHWETGTVEVPRLGSHPVQRPIFQKVSASSESKFITALRGLRRTGKSVLARQLMQDVVTRQSSRAAAWFEFDRAMQATDSDLDALIRYFQTQGAKTIFLDEIMFVPQWQDVLKRHYDRSETKFIVTGSSALEMDQRSSESLAGRVQTIHVRPFNLTEVLALHGKKVPTALEKARDAESFYLEAESYLKMGGMPEIAQEQDETARNKYIRESLLEPLYYKDLPAVFSGANPDLLGKTMELLAGTVPNTYQLQSISEGLGCNHPTAGTQVSVLERGLLVHSVLNHTPSLARQKRTAKKIAFADNAILRALRPDISLGALAEQAVFNALEITRFFRTPLAEVDALIPERKIAIEVKYQEHVTSTDEKALTYFLERRPEWTGVLITKVESDTKSDITRIPLWKVLLDPKVVHGKKTD